MAGHRVNRVAEDIRREVVALLRELKDPRVQGQLLTVVRVQVSSDASLAKVYVSSLAGMDSAKQAVKGLESATGYLRREIGNRLHLRKAPELRFVADNSTQHAMDIAKKLEGMQSQREELIRKVPPSNED